MHAPGAMALCVALAVAVSVSGGRSANSSDDAGAFVQDLGDKVIGLIRQTELARSSRETKFRNLLVENIDLRSVSRAALGRYWRMATDVQIARYQTIYPDYVIAIYGGLFENYSDETLKVTGAQPVGGGDVLVDSEITRGKALPLNVIFRVRRRGDGFKVLDVMVEGISMLVTQRSEFASVIQSKGMDGFLQRMQEISEQKSP
jgi:phospholipid transport system substrate-binding protein